MGLGSIIIFTGLFIRSLWCSEGRWAVISKEMIESGNFFYPTINGVLYFDKPLLSYWAIIPFSLKSGVIEVTSRIPSAIAGFCTVIITFIIGRRLFDSKTSFISTGLLLTTIMFLFWARHASSNMLNLLSMWLMFFFFITGGLEGRFFNLFVIYSIGAIAFF
ncbi:MAG TPA: glycosyltransferase family 39 protein [Syntrophorhabdaceae bacterium]|nr:glycosyltransferase family 39 protein [Syntrophorhabdaceae bacterium]